MLLHEKQPQPRDESEGEGGLVSEWEWGEWVGRLWENESESERGKGQQGGVTPWGKREAKRGRGAVKLSEAMTMRGVSKGEGKWPTMRA